MENLKKCKCEKTAVDELLRTGMVGGPAQVFKRYHEQISHASDFMCLEKREN